MELGKKSVKNTFLYTIKKTLSTLLKFCFVFRGVWQNTNSQGQNVTFDKICTNSIATWALGSCPDFFREFCYLLYRSTRIDEKNMTTATKNTICKAVLLGSSTLWRESLKKPTIIYLHFLYILIIENSHVVEVFPVQSAVDLTTQGVSLWITIVLARSSGYIPF